MTPDGITLFPYFMTTIYLPCMVWGTINSSALRYIGGSLDVCVCSWSELYSRTLHACFSDFSLSINIFLLGVYVPDEQVLGDENSGWTSGGGHC